MLHLLIRPKQVTLHLSMKDICRETQLQWHHSSLVRSWLLIVCDEAGCGYLCQLLGIRRIPLRKSGTSFYVYNCRTLEPRFVVMFDVRNKDIFVCLHPIQSIFAIFFKGLEFFRAEGITVCLMLHLLFMVIMCIWSMPASPCSSPFTRPDGDLYKRAVIDVLFDPSTSKEQTSKWNSMDENRGQWVY